MKILTILLIVYYVLDMLFPHGNDTVESMRIFPQISMALSCMYCIYIIINNRKLLNKQSLLKPYIAFLILSFVYVAYPLISMTMLYNNFIYFMKFYMAIMFMLALFVFLEKNPKRAMPYVYVIYGVQLIYGFYKLFLDRAIYNTLDNHEAFDSNAGFILICLLPMALTLPKPRLRLYVCAAVVLGCVYSGQRSAALAAILCLPFCLMYLKNSIKKTDIIIFVLAFVFVVAPILQEALLNIQQRNEIDMDKGSFGSGRSVFWKHVWDGFWSGNIFQIFFGNGTNSVPSLLKRTYGMAIAAHSGWLDALYTFGLFGFVIYCRTIFLLYKKNKFINKRLPHMRNMFLILFVLFFVKCTTSHGYWDISAMPFSMTIAIIAHQLSQKRKSIEMLSKVPK